MSNIGVFTVREMIEPEMTKFGPIDMFQYQRLFGTTRIPAFPFDKLVDCGFPTKSDYIIVLINEQVFHVKVQNNTKEIYSESVIGNILKDIIKKKVKPSPPVGIFTSENRDLWGKMREQMIQLFPENVQFFDKINNSLFAVSLENFNSKVDDREPAKVALHGLNGTLFTELIL
jgi:carnitine O-acetyltransferase